MNTPKRPHPERFQRIAGALWIAALLGSVGAASFDPDERNPIVAGGLIATILFFTAWMIARSINQRRRLESLRKVLSDLEDEPHIGK